MRFCCCWANFSNWGFIDQFCIFVSTWRERRSVQGNNRDNSRSSVPVLCWRNCPHWLKTTDHICSFAFVERKQIIGENNQHNGRLKTWRIFKSKQWFLKSWASSILAYEASPPPHFYVQNPVNTILWKNAQKRFRCSQCKNCSTIQNLALFPANETKWPKSRNNLEWSGQSCKILDFTWTSPEFEKVILK